MEIGDKAMDLKKTKVNMYASEKNIKDLIDEFANLCDEREYKCDGCKIVRDHNGSKEPHYTKCLARYIYERIIKTDSK